MRWGTVSGTAIDVCVLCLVVDPDPGGEVAGHPDVVNPEQPGDVGGPDQAAGRGGVGDVDRAQAVGRGVSILWHISTLLCTKP